MAPSATFSEWSQSAMHTKFLDPCFRHHSQEAAKFPDHLKWHTKTFTLVSGAGNTLRPWHWRGCDISPWNASVGARCWFCSPGPHHSSGHNPAQLQVGKLVLNIKNMHYPHFEDLPGVLGGLVSDSPRVGAAPLLSHWLQREMSVSMRCLELFHQTSTGSDVTSHQIPPTKAEWKEVCFHPSWHLEM